MEKEISLIAAFAKNRVIGNKGLIPWDLPEDQQRFKQLTSGGVVIMGRRTFEEIFAKLGKPLPGRNTIVVSKTKQYEDFGCDTAGGLTVALEIAESKFLGKPIFICGGAQLYKEALEMKPSILDNLYLTEVELAVEGDTFFPGFDVGEFGLFSRERVDGSIPFTFSVYKKKLTGAVIQKDSLLNGYTILQDKERFMYGIDAVLLSAFAASGIRKKNNVVDLGTGTGIIPLLLESSSYAAHISGLEIQSESADLAKKSVALNGLENHISIVQGDIKSVPDGKLFEKHSVEVVTSNPPYMITNHCKECSNDAKSIARHEVLCSLEDVVSAADFLLKPHGIFYLIHRPYRLPEIFAAFERHNLEPKRMQLIYPFVDKEPNMVLIEAKKNAQPELKIEAPLVVREKNGEYTEQIKKIYDSFKTSIR